MNTDPEGEQAAFKLIKLSFVVVAFSACHYRKTETTTSVSHIQFTLPDSTVKIVKKAPPSKKRKRTLYLTFDDGPNKGTRKVMHIAEQDSIDITMFIIGEHVYGSREQTATYDSLLKCKFIELDNHSYSHAFNNHYDKFYACTDSAIKDFIRCADSLHFTANIIRTPGRNIWRTENVTATDIKASKTTADSLQEKGFTEVGWDLEWQYDKDLNLKSTSDDIMKQVDSVFTKGKTKTPGCLVLLAHDQVYADANDSIELDALVKILKATDEYDFEVISNYPNLKK